ncbi:hypothetical protein DV735_g747, partial [Chaetothyriales sp. CBS 134920]
MGDRYRRDRGHDENVEYFGAGESYRPGGHSGQGPYRPPYRPPPTIRQPGDSWSSSERHEREWDKERERPRDGRDGRREDVDSYVPPPSGPLGPPRRRNGQADDSWRRPSPSPRNSNGPSRRSSPRVVLDRVSSAPRSPAAYSSRHDNDIGLVDDYRDRAPPPAAAPPLGPSRNGNYDRPYDRERERERAPPSGPSHAPTPTGPALSGHSGPPPSRPRGGAYNPPPAARGRSSLVYRAPSYSTDTAPPAGPRGSGYGRGSSDYYPPSNPSSGPGASVPDGQLLPSGFTADQELKLKHLEAEAERMRTDLREKQARVRDSLAEWDVRQRESAREALRSELAENNLRSIEADGDDNAMDVAAF